MGKIKRETALKMVKAKQLSQENFDKMEASGQIAKMKGSSIRVMKTKSNTWVMPTFYYKGLNESKVSKEMIELRKKVLQLIVEHTISKSETNEVSK